MTKFETNHENPADSTLQAARWEADKGGGVCRQGEKTVGVNRRKPVRSLGEGQEGGTLKKKAAREEMEQERKKKTD
jgi:hypothetical protein